MPRAPDWPARLAPGERLIWQGAPEVPKRRLVDRLDADALSDFYHGDTFGKLALFMIFAMVWIAITLESGWGFVAIGVAMLVGAPLAIIARPFLRDWRLRGTFYALTGNRALFLWRPWGIVTLLRDRPIRPGLRIGYDGHTPGTISFASAAERQGAFAGHRDAFEYLPDAQTVLALVQAALADRIATDAADDG
jgi:hypothetical protein